MPFSLRPEEPGDETFLLELYGTTRQEELDLTNWDAATRANFIQQQFRAMRYGYQTMFPRGQFSIVAIDNQPVGRLVINRANDEIRVVDLALLPAYRSRGIGTSLMKMVLNEAAKAHKPVRLHVIAHSRAFAWYLRLHFTCLGEPGLYQEMQFRRQA